MKPFKQSKYLALLLVSLSCSVSVLAQKVKCNISGVVTDSATTKIALIETGENNRSSCNIIYVPVNDGKFSYQLKTNAIRYYKAIACNQLESGSWRQYAFIAENANVNIVMHAIGDNTTTETQSDGVEGMKMKSCNDMIDARFRPLYDRMQAKYDDLGRLAKSWLAEAQNDAQRDSIQNCLKFLREGYQVVGNQYRKYSEQADSAKRAYIAEHPSMYGLFCIYENLQLPSPSNADYAAIYNNVYASLFKNHPYHQSIRSLVLRQTLKPGNRYIDYDVRGPKDKTVKLSSLYTGKIIYIDLWASWCGPCRNHAKSIIPIYEKYKDRGFQVVGISRERSREAMESAVRKDGYPWLTLLEKNDEHRVWEKNGISLAGGGGFLIDDTGTILSVYPNADELAKILHDKLK